LPSFTQCGKKQGSGAREEDKMALQEGGKLRSEFPEDSQDAINIGKKRTFLES